MTKSVSTVWVSTLPQCATVHLAMYSLTSLHQTNQEHVDMGVSRVRRDVVDMKKFEDWLDVNDPFDVRDGRLRSLSTGVTATDSDV
jgi:hypothetical protein